MLEDWALDLEKKGKPGKETLKRLKKELENHGVDASVCPF